MFSSRGKRGDELQRGGLAGDSGLQASGEDVALRGRNAGSHKASVAAFARLRDPSRARVLSTPGMPAAMAHESANLPHASLQHQQQPGRSSRALLPEELVAALVSEQGQKAQRLPELPLLSPLTLSASSFITSPASVQRTPSAQSFMEVTPSIRTRTSSSLLDRSQKRHRRRSASATERGRCAMETSRVGRAFSSSALQQSASSSPREEEDGDETEAFFRSHGFSSNSPSRRKFVPFGDSPVEEDDDLDENTLNTWQQRKSFTTDLKLRRKDMRQTVAHGKHSDVSASEAEDGSDTDASSGEDDTEEMQAGPSMSGEQMPGGYISQAEEARKNALQSPSAARTVERPPALQLDTTSNQCWPAPGETLLTAHSAEASVLRPWTCSLSPAEALRGHSAPASPTTSRLPRPLTASATTARPPFARRLSTFRTDEDVIGAAEMVIAVVGPKRVGKTTVIQSGLRKLSVGRVLSEDQHYNQLTSYHASFQVSGVQRTAEILEIDSGLIRTTDEGVLWPEDMSVPHGVLVCYDATDTKALPELRRILSGLWRRGGLISVALACKSSKDVKTNHLSPHAAAEACNVFGVGVIQLDGGIEDEAKKTRNSFGWIIRRILTVHGITSRPLSRPSTSMSFVSLDQLVQPATAPQVKRVSVRKAHSRYASAGSDLIVDSPASPPTSSPEAERPMLLPKSPVSARFVRPMQLDGRPGDLDLFFSKDVIIDKALFAAVAGNDEPFIDQFLVVYRRFARPYEVLNALIKRFDALSASLSSGAQLVRYAQQRLCNALARWLKTCPGDFVSSPTQGRLQAFLQGLILSQHVGHYAFELLPLVKTLTHGLSPEGPWALPDNAEESVSIARQRSPGPPAGSSGPGSDRASTGDSDSVVHISRSMSVSSATAESSYRDSHPPRKTAAVAKERTLLNCSNAMLECPEDAIAVQITRSAWETFSELTPRDLLRYVMTPRDDRDSAHELQQDLSSPVARSIHFVNYLAAWTASLILVQPKQKPRGRLLEKFIGIAACLRELDNFDCCMGVLAGLNAQPVFRLEASWELLRDKPIYKRFRSLNKLMSSSRSFAAYRMALSNSKADRIPYLGAHLQDLVRICESKTDMRDGLVNWSKFSQLAEYANVVMHCVALAPNLPCIPEAERLISEVTVLDNETLYSLSHSIMPRGQRKGRLRKLLEAAISPTSTAPLHGAEWLHSSFA